MGVLRVISSVMSVFVFSMVVTQPSVNAAMHSVAATQTLSSHLDNGAAGEIATTVGETDERDVVREMAREAYKENAISETVYDNIVWFVSTLEIGEELYEDDTKIDAISFIAQLFLDKDWQSLNDRFFKINEPGTAGVRGKRMIGTAGVNEKLIALFVEAHARYINEEYAKMGKKLGRERAILLGYDSRLGSLEYDENGLPVGPGFYMKLAASIYAANGIKVYMFDREVPTPEVSFALAELNHIKPFSALIGTASHNPKPDNGIKPYDYYGGQVVNGRITAIAKGIASFAEVKRGDYDTFFKKGKIKIVGEKIDRAYLRKTGELAINTNKNGKWSRRIDKNLKIAFTSVNGTAHRLVPRLLKRLGFNMENFFPVEAQCKPDANFTTCPKPNPEDIEALDEVLKVARQNDADIACGTDPDADRIGVAVKLKDSEKPLYQDNKKQYADGYFALTGNQQLVVLWDYVLTQLSEKGELPENSVIAKTIVSTDLLKDIAERNGVKVVEPHVGFKYIGEKLHYYQQVAMKKALQDPAFLKKFEDAFGKDLRVTPYRKLKRTERVWLLSEFSLVYLFGGEESYGSLLGDLVKDKDAVVVSMLFAEVAGFYKKMGMTITERLQEIYHEYGYAKEVTESRKREGAAGAQEISAIVSAFRSDTITEFAGKKVVAKVDFKEQKAYDVTGALLFDNSAPEAQSYTGYFEHEGVQVPMFHTADYSVIGDKALLPVANVLMFVLEDGSKIEVRPSGTEPKIKYYLLLRGDADNQAAVDVYYESALSEIENRAAEAITSLAALSVNAVASQDVGIESDALVAA